MIEWVEELRAGFTEEFGTGPKIVTLATLEAAHRLPRPRARSMVCRRVLDAGFLIGTCDSRSEKHGQLRFNRVAEVCAWLPKLRRQFRLAGPAILVGDDKDESWRFKQAYRGEEGEDVALPEELTSQDFREQVWAELSEATRATFFWPHPGAAFVADPAAFPRAVRTGLPPTNFELIVLWADEVDLLELGQHPHGRRQWVRKGGEWRVKSVNP